MLDSVIRVNKKYFPQTLLEECNYEIKKNKMKSLIHDDFDASSSDESDTESNNEPDSEPESEPDNEFDNNESNESKH